MRDPVIEEIRERRRKLVKDRYGGSIGKMLDAARKWQKAHHGKVSNLRKRHAWEAVA